MSMVAGSFMLLPLSGADARRPQEATAPPAIDRAAQTQERAAQAQAVRAEQEQFQKQHEDEMRQAATSRQQQEQALRAQEDQARKAQQEAMKQQQQQVRAQQEQQGRAQQEQVRAQQEQQVRAQQEQARAQQQEQGRAQQEQARAQQEQARQAQERDRQNQGRAAAEQQQHTAVMERQPGAAPGGAAHEHGGRPGVFVNDRGGNPVTARQSAPPPISSARLPLQRAIAMPVLAAQASAADREHFQEVQRNLQAHLIAVAAADAPSNYHDLGRLAREAYFNNYQANINNQILTINRENTFINALAQEQWPAWYQPDPNWQFCNGFTLGNSVVADLNWLRWGWHPYYGPAPEGFICARNYVPTPWIYLPAYGTWRQPGVNSYAQYGPPYDYTGPISVEVFEPRTLNVNVPFLGMLPERVINAVYFYNAYYYPDFGRYGYMNRHNNWIWLDLNPMPM
jgi:actin-related protein